MAFGDTPYQSSLSYALQARRQQTNNDLANALGSQPMQMQAGPDGSYGFGPDGAPPAQSGQPRQAFSPGDLTGIQAPIQGQINRQADNLAPFMADYTQMRGAQRQDYQKGLMDTLNSSMQASIPDVKNSLAGLNLVESGAYPEALARRQQQLVASQVLPQMSQFDQGTFDQLSGLPLQNLQSQNGLETGSLSRDYALQDQANQQSFQMALAQKQADQQKLQSLLGLVPSLIGLMGAGGAGGANGQIGGGSSGGLGGILGGIGGAGGAGGLGALGGLLSGSGSLLGGGIGGGLGSALGGSLGIGNGWGGALGGMLGGGGLTGALGGGLGGAFGGNLGAGIGGALGSVLNPSVTGYAKNAWDNGQLSLPDFSKLFGFPQKPTALPLPTGPGDSPLPLPGMIGSDYGVPYY